MTFLIRQLPPDLFNFYFYSILTKLGSYDAFSKITTRVRTQKKKAKNVS